MKTANIFNKILLVTLVFACFTATAQDSEQMDKVEKGVDKYLSYFSGDNPGAVVTVIKRGDVIFSKAYGMANIDTKEQMKGAELFNLAELSKSFTALAILHLVEKNKLSLDHNLKEIFLEFPDYGKAITLRNLLDHKSGLVSYDAKEIKSSAELFNFLLQQENTAFEPGTKTTYSNSDYSLLVNVIEKVSKMTYQEYLRKNIFKKMQLDNTFFVEELEGKNIAESHFKEKDEYVVEKEIGNILGEQGIYMNAFDYAKYDKALYTDKILKCENLKKIFRVGKLSNNENISDYGYGWTLMAKKGIRYFWQGGLRGGYSNLVLHLPDTQTTVLILTNRNDGYDFLKMAIYIAKLFDKDLKL
ncbi:MAG: hypothetical protein C0597_17030 [Marinilabiliales bacterium]|nr:MAG: hypothetical protein C0597_17030 [Marinilabiliales bacterium]